MILQPGTPRATRLRRFSLLLALCTLSCSRRATTPPVTVAAPVPAADVRLPVADSVAPAPLVPQGSIDTVRFWSPSLGTTKRYLVWLPPAYRDGGASASYPVAYYLHGLYGDETNWARQGRLGATLDSLVAAGMPPMIVVMPDGDDSWYTTWNRLVDAGACRADTVRREPAERYCVPWARYDEYIARDLVAHVDTTYRTIARRGSRGIAGLSMGGYGAVTLALRYGEVFSAAASHSGVLSPLYDGAAPFAPPPGYVDDAAQLQAKWRRVWPLISPAFGSDTAAWWARDPARLARAALAAQNSQGARHALPRLRFDSGVDDKGIIDENRAFHHELVALGIAHDWIERPGAHTWDYWRREVPHSLAWLAASLDARGGAR